MDPDCEWDDNCECTCHDLDLTIEEHGRWHNTDNAYSNIAYIGG